MSEKLKTPRGRALHPVKRRDKPDVTEWRGDPLQVWITAARRFAACFDESSSADFDTMAEALDWLDARADETVAELLPEGSLVVTEDRVRELAKVLVTRIAEDIPQGVVMPNERIEALIAALRAEGKS